MNGYELADAIETLSQNNADIELQIREFMMDSAKMLRQQADRIAELEKKSKPVAWVYQTKNVDGEPYLTNVSLKPLFGLVTRYGYKEIPLYTTPQTKPLSDEEIDDCVDNCFGVHAFNLDYEWTLEQVEVNSRQLARAIEERHGIK